MKALKIFLLVIIFLLVMVTGWVYQAGLGAEKTLLDIDYYRELMHEASLVAFLREAMLEGMAAAGAEEIGAGLNTAITKAFAETFDEAWCEEKVLATLEEFLKTFKGRGDLSSLTVDLRDRRGVLQEKIKDICAGLNPAELSALGLGNAEAAVQEFMKLAGIPEELKVVEFLHQETLQSIESAKSLRTIGLYLPYAVFAVCLLFCLLLAGWGGGLKWFGSGILVSGLSCLLLLYPLRALLLASGVEASFTINEVAFSGEALAEIYMAVMRYTFDRLIMFCLLFAGAGLLLFILGLIIGIIIKRKKAAQATAA